MILHAISMTVWRSIHIFLHLAKMEDKQSASKRLMLPVSAVLLPQRKLVYSEIQDHSCIFIPRINSTWPLEECQMIKPSQFSHYCMSNRIHFQSQEQRVSFGLNSYGHTANKCSAFFCWVEHNVSAKNWYFILGDSQLR